MRNKTNEAPHFPKGKTLERPKKVFPCDCHRCGGSGIMRPWGTCFRCGGVGKDPTAKDWMFPAAWTDKECAEWDSARIARNDKKREAKRLSGIETANLLLPESTRVRAIWFDDLAGGTLKGCPRFLFHGMDFVNDVFAKAVTFEGKISEKAVHYAEKAAEAMRSRYEAHLTESAARGEAPDGGRFEVTGEVLSMKAYESNFGTCWKMLVSLPKGVKVFGSIPSAPVN